MARTKTSSLAPEAIAEIRDAWLNRLTGLIDRFERWSQAQGWSTRRITKNLSDSTIGPHKAPALLMQEGVTRLLLEPIGPSGPGVEGIVDLYQLPAYDDVARLFYEGGQWLVDDSFLGQPNRPENDRAAFQPLTQEVMEVILQEMMRRDA